MGREETKWNNIKCLVKAREGRKRQKGNKQ
jgi:hypothetical protein